MRPISNFIFPSFDENEDKEEKKWDLEWFIHPNRFLYSEFKYFGFLNFKLKNIHSHFLEIFFLRLK